jgi:hypothetical protein
MLDNRKRAYMLATFTVEKRATGWFFKKTYGDDDWHGPYASEASVSLMIARKLKHVPRSRSRDAFLTIADNDQLAPHPTAQATLNQL